MVFARTSLLRKVVKRVPLIIIAVIYVILPVLGLKGYWLDILTRVNIFLLITLSLDIYSGTTLYLNLGVPFTVACASYALALLNRDLKIPLELGVPIATIAAVVLSFIIFLPSLRIRGVYFSILSLLLPIILAGIITSQPYSLYLGGEGGISFQPLLFSFARGLPPRERLPFLQSSYFYISSIAATAALYITYRIAYSDFGFMLRAIGQDELLAESSGIDTLKVKLRGFLVSSTLAALAGALYAAMRPPVTVDIVIPANTLIPPLTSMILGGMGTIIGPTIANYITIIGYEVLWDLIGRWRVVVYMGLLIMLVILRPQGVIFYIYWRLRHRLVNMLSRIRIS